jgi:hypothetical protein
LNVIEKWRERLELKYKLIINGHNDEEARGGEKDWMKIWENFILF